MSDKRSVATDALETLGTHNIPDNSGRDAIHLAVEPVIAGATLYPNQSIGISNGVALAVSDTGKAVGIVDPFIPGPVQKGERFWLVVFPRKITSLRHVWSHPDFPEEDIAPELVSSEAWMRDFADQLGADYSEVLDHARYHVESDEYWVEGGRFEGESCPPEFWEHFTAITGIEAKDKGTFFSCSC